MHPPRLAALFSAALFLAAPATAQAIYGISERIPPFTPLHTAVYTTTLAQTQSPQVITTVIVTLLVPRDVGWPNAAAPVTGTAVSHFYVYATQPSGATSTWAETTQLIWTLAGNGQQEVKKNTNTAAAQADAKATTLAGVYTDYSHYTTEMYANMGWSRSHLDFVSTYRETIVEEVGADYPATMVQTGRTTIEITATGGPLGFPLTTFTNPATLVSVRTTTLVQVAARPTVGSG